jgi:hypothetical protein
LEPCILKLLILLLGNIWASPVTIAAYCIARFLRMPVTRSHGAINFDADDTFVGKCCDKLGISGFTLGQCVIYAFMPDEAIHFHEYRHVQQYRVLGPFFLPIYFLLLLMFGYADHPLEKDAREYEIQKCGTRFSSKLL